VRRVRLLSSLSESGRNNPDERWDNDEEVDSDAGEAQLSSPGLPKTASPRTKSSVSGRGNGDHSTGNNAASAYGDQILAKLIMHASWKGTFCKPNRENRGADPTNRE
jgi:hypothetical protein